MPSGANIGGFWHKSASIKHTKADFDVFRPAAGKWFHLDQKTWTWSESPWGISGDKAMSADFDGDGDTDTSIWRSSTKQFWVNFSSTGSTWNTTFGNSTDIPVPADYDFDGRDDIALYRPSTGEWFLVDWRSWTFTTKNVGQSGGVPAPADFDGDRKADPAIWIPSTGNWHVLRSSGGPVVVTQWGCKAISPHQLISLATALLTGLYSGLPMASGIFFDPMVAGVSGLAGVRMATSPFRQILMQMEKLTLQFSDRQMAPGITPFPPPTMEDGLSNLVRMETSP